MSPKYIESWENEGGSIYLPLLEVSQLKDIWGSETEKWIKHFDIGDDFFSQDFITTLLITKKIMAESNHHFGFLSSFVSDSIINAVDYLIEAKDFSNFPTKIWQTGSGTGLNMNVNETISIVANTMKKSKLIHPNDHVNLSQSSNDIIPTTLNILTTKLIVEKLLPEMKKLESELKNKERQFENIIKVGRTHMMDAVPMSLGQEFSAFKYQIKENILRIEDSIERVKYLPLGGTAIGTGIHCPEEVSNYAIEEISKSFNIKFIKIENLFSGISSSDAIVELSGQLKTLATSLLKIATDISILSSGPNAGIGELILPNNESGSSIMPGKVNPTQCEALSMVCCQVIGNDTAITLGGMQGKLQLNTFRPLMIKNIIESINLLADSIKSFNRFCLKDIKENTTNISAHMNKSKMIVTALISSIGYDQAVDLVKSSNENNTTLLSEIKKNDKFNKDEIINKLEPQGLIFPPAL